MNYIYLSLYRKQQIPELSHWTDLGCIKIMQGKTVRNLAILLAFLTERLRRVWRYQQKQSPGNTFNAAATGTT